MNKRILSFSVAPPVSSLALNDSAQWNRPLRHKTNRTISDLPVRVLDAPGILDDYYLNLCIICLFNFVVDWSSTNQVAIALNDAVFIWDASSGSVQELCTTEDDYVSSVKWTGDGTYLAIGTGNGDTQIWDAGLFPPLMYY